MRLGCCLGALGILEWAWTPWNRPSCISCVLFWTPWHGMLRIHHSTCPCRSACSWLLVSFIVSMRCAPRIYWFSATRKRLHTCSQRPTYEPRPCNRPFTTRCRLQWHSFPYYPQRKLVFLADSHSQMSPSMIGWCIPFSWIFVSGRENTTTCSLGSFTVFLLFGDSDDLFTPCYMRIGSG